MLPALQRVLDGHDSALVPVAPRQEPPPALRVGDAIDDDVALVVTTSGTTGAPKGAMLTAAALTASAAATHDRLGGPGRWLLALPPHHIAGVQVLVRSLLADGVAVAPSAIPSRKDPSKLSARALSGEEIEHLIECFGRAAELGVKAGYDAFELHGAHGYLLTSFLSPMTNHRDDIA